MKKRPKKRLRVYLVSFEIRTKSLSLGDLSKKIGIYPSSGSRTKGEKKKLGKETWIEKSTWFRLFSHLPKTAKLERHLDLIIKRVELSKVFKKGVLPKDSRLSICIAEISSLKKSPVFELWIPEKYVSWCGKHNLFLDIVSYTGL